MVFLPGDHALDMNITVANVARLTMHGESPSGSTATIVCSGSVGLSFTSMVELKMDSLAFTSCTRRYATILPGSSLGIIQVAMLLHSTQSAELVSCSFHDNNGIALVVNNTNITLAARNEFKRNHMLCGNILTAGGGAIAALDSNVTFTGNTTFLDNSASCSAFRMVLGGGAISTSGHTVLSFNGISNFINNSADYGGAISTSAHTVLSFNGTSNFINNSADYGGAISTSGHTVLSFNGTSNFINNSADYGGAISTSGHTVLSFNGTSNFINNSADYGGAISTSGHTILCFNGISNFINNSVDGSGGDGGGAIYTSDNTVLRFNGTSNFINNSAGLFGFNSAVGGNGGAIYIYESHNTVLSFKGISNFINNSADWDGAISTIGNTVLSFNGINNFINNSAEWGGAIYTLFRDTLTFNGTIYFTNNGHYGGRVNTHNGYTYGGGLYLGLKCTFSILPNTTVYWENNHASLGGAIYVCDASPISYCWTLALYVPKEECFFQLPGQNLSNHIDVQLVFKNNSADTAGSVLYGGAVDNCKLTIPSYSSGKVFDRLVHNDDTDYDTTSNFSSDPLQICSYENNLPDCRWPFYQFPRTVYPGEIFQVSVVAVGQRNGTVPSTVRSAIDNIQYPGDKLAQ